MWNLAVQTTKAWSMDHDLGAIVKEPEAQPELVEVAIPLAPPKIKHGWKIAIPCFHLLS
jgi:hypothetical protein